MWRFLFQKILMKVIKLIMLTRICFIFKWIGPNFSDNYILHARQRILARVSPGFNWLKALVCLGIVVLSINTRVWTGHRGKIWKRYNRRQHTLLAQEACWVYKRNSNLKGGSQGLVKPWGSLGLIPTNPQKPEQ